MTTTTQADRDAAAHYLLAAGRITHADQLRAIDLYLEGVGQ